MSVTATDDLAHFLCRATMVLLRMYASFLWAQVIIVWNIAKWMPTVFSTLWAVTIHMGKGLFLPVAYRLGSYLWTCLSDTYSALYNASGMTEAISYASTKRELWVLSLCHWKVSIIVGIVGSVVILVFEHFDAFDERTAGAEVLQRAVQVWARDTGHTAFVNVEGMVPTPGAYNFGKAYKLNYRADEKTNSEE